MHSSDYHIKQSSLLYLFVEWLYAVFITLELRAFYVLKNNIIRFLNYGNWCMQYTLAHTSALRVYVAVGLWCNSRPLPAVPSLS